MYKILFVSVLCLSPLLVYAYDWTDTDFNYILQSDLLENADFFDEDLVPLNHRVTRDVEKPMKNEKTPGPSSECSPSSPANNEGLRYQRACCGERDDLKMHGEALKELRKECFKELRRTKKSKSEEAEPIDMFNCDRVTKLKDDTVCAMECVGKKKYVVDSYGNIDSVNVTRFVKSELVTKDWQKEIIDSVLEKCLKKNTDQEDIVSGKDTSKCNSSSLKFSHCLWREMQLSCPKDLARDTKACQRMRERLQKKEFPNFDRRGRPRPGRPDKGSKKNKDE